MHIVFIKVSDERHGLEIVRADGTAERVELPSREFLRHDLSHFAIESEWPIRRGYWGCVSAGASLDGRGVTGAEARFAESLAGPVQTLMRIEAGPIEYLDLFRRLAPADADSNLAARVCECVRRLRGQWNATPYGGRMKLTWTDQEYPNDTCPARC